ncbi:MAG: class I tRNA ligase family protein [bacterium]|nr:class I tRNA ligase family protein [bacterium]
MHDEHEVLGFWAQRKIFEKSIKQRGAKAKRFVFFEGPPYANGLPGIHHVEARAFKDVVARYKTLRGFRVERRAGWDTHGLPTEMAVEKKLGIKSKREIEERIGVKAFVQAAREDVFFYKREWERMTERMGYWLDFKNAYVTMDNSYIESLWWIMKEFWDKKLFYEDRKVLPWCSRCGTGLSTHEVAQGYKKITETSVYVRFYLKTRRGVLLVWTTTPWTLPANVAAAVDPKATYVTIDDRGEKFILHEKLASKLFPSVEPQFKEKGSDLVGLTYDPPFGHDDIPYKVVGADFVSDKDGTGIVHIAPAFGEDDMRVAKDEELPVLMTVDDEGKFNDEVPQWKGQFVKDADPDIIKDLKQKGILWREEEYEHDYPFCWRCDSPLIYLARKSWWVKVSSMRQQLVEANKEINWYPEYLKEGRFGQWISEAKDWAFSRERYWGTPIPVWQCTECNNSEMFGSVEEMKKRTRPSLNNYFLMRHGLAKSNMLDIGVGNPKDDVWGITPKGKLQVKKAITKLKKEDIDLVISSDLLRTKETAQMIAKELHVPILYDEDLREMQFGDYERKNSRPIMDEWGLTAERLDMKLPGMGAESWNDIKARMNKVFKRLEELHKNKNIVLVGHGDPHWFLEAIMTGSSDPEGIPDVAVYPTKGDFHKVTPVSLPRDDKGNLDLHKPFIDEVKIDCTRCRAPMRRTIGVADVWFDSGSMPYAAWHYPFENKAQIDKKISFPADYIAEAIDQTRGWFYNLLSVSVLLGKGAPYKNVISLGHVLDKKGKKMSKSKGNGVNPMDLFEKYGADAVRWYFFTVNQPEDSKVFDELDIQKAKRNFLDLLTNSAKFYEMYKTSKRTTKKHVLDEWVLARLGEVREDMTKKMDEYDIVGAARELEKFVAEDISRWYLRRSRERMRTGQGVSILRTVLLETAILASPFVPFTSEILYTSLGGKSKSVHLSDWPEKRASTRKLLTDMQEVRMLAARGLELRSRSGLKIRQPLASFSVKSRKLKEKKLLNVLAEELNVKNILIGKKIKEDVELDTVLTPILKEEGEVRETIRLVQNMRKEEGLHPRDLIMLTLSGTFSKVSLKSIKDGVHAKTVTLKNKTVKVEIHGITKV